ncbi:MAG: sigma-54-dependent Fis family transcriptional regulator [Leptospiraceae bacterium]|nr:sigma-54-dependent Fis family transcriptional regulator [Leptospiraceae bacterium]
MFPEGIQAASTPHRVDPSVTFVFQAGGAMAEILELAERFAEHSHPVLIEGETGTGKERVARIIHGLSSREGPLVALNCSAIPADLVENELFGHIQGAYTGADRDTEGYVQRAAGGTLFLDEIGDLPLIQQVKLLRLVQEGEFEKVGSSETLQADVRFIFATNRNLEEEIYSGGFRSDLFYRIQTFSLRLPPLRERPGDIRLLIDHYLWLAAEQFNRHGLLFSPEALRLLNEYSWPGNVRELENLVFRCALLSPGLEIQVEQLPEPVRNHDLEFRRRKVENLRQELEKEEKELLQATLGVTGGNQRQAARLLGISRGSLQHQLKKYPELWKQYST